MSSEEDKEIERLADMIAAISESNACPAIIEHQIKLVEEEFSKAGRKIELFHKSVVELKNQRLYDEDLNTIEGTRKALRELAIYSNNIDNTFRAFSINREPKADVKY